MASGGPEATPRVPASAGTSQNQCSPSCLAGFLSSFLTNTYPMAIPTGSSSSLISLMKEPTSFTAEAPHVRRIGTVSLLKGDHGLVPWMEHLSSIPNQPAGLVEGLEHPGIDWISVQHWGSYDGVQLRLVHNARGLLVRPWGQYIEQADNLIKLEINDGEFTLHTPAPGIRIPANGHYFPPGSLQLVVDGDRQICNEFTTLPIPTPVKTVPCSGWCKKQHIYGGDGMTELSVIFFDGRGWPIACRENAFRENAFDGSMTTLKRAGCQWWRYDYSRPIAFIPLS